MLLLYYLFKTLVLKRRFILVLVLFWLSSMYLYRQVLFLRFMYEQVCFNLFTY